MREAFRRRGDHVRRSVVPERTQHGSAIVVAADVLVSPHASPLHLPGATSVVHWKALRSSLHRVFAAVLGIVLAAGCGTILSIDSDPAAPPHGDGSAGSDAAADGGADGGGCSQGTSPCGDLCVDTRTSQAHCGRCANACNRGACLDGGCERTVFVTSGPYGGNLGGLTGADQRCADHASDAGLGGKYLAWLADATKGPSDRFTRDSAGYLLPDGGGLVAAGWTDLVDGTLQRRINVDEKGALGQDPVWTNVAADGRPDGKTSCSNWTSSEAGTGSIGSTGALEKEWTTQGLMNPCFNVFRLYCFEQ